MDRIISTVEMANGRRMLLETLSAHFALLKASCPREANTTAARRAQQYVSRTLRSSHRRRAA